MQNIVKWIVFLGLVPSVIALCQGCWNADSANQSKRKKSTPVSADNSSEVETKDSDDFLEERRKLDETVWANEVQAQKYEAVFVRLWDRIRNADAAGKLSVLADFPFTGELTIGTPGPAETLKSGISLSKFQSEPSRTFNEAKWGKFVRSIEDAGVQIVQTEWHHSRFVPASDSSAPTSTISFTIHAIRVATQTL